MPSVAPKQRGEVNTGIACGNRHDMESSPYTMTYSTSPQPFWHEGPVSWKTILPWTGGGGGVGERVGFRIIQVHYICCALHFYLSLHCDIQWNNYTTHHDAAADLTGDRAQAEVRGWEAAVNRDEASLAGLPLTSCCVAQFLKGHGPCYQFIAQGLRTPDLQHMMLVFRNPWVWTHIWGV